MNPELAKIARRRQGLLSRSAAERQALARNWQQLEKSLLIRAAGGLLLALKSSPAWLLGLGALFLRKRRKASLAAAVFSLILRRILARWPRAAR